MNKPPFTALDVLYRAYTIITSGANADDPHGPMCVWCAIAKAKGELDIIHNVPMPPLWVDLCPSDMPLVEARGALRQWASIDVKTLTKDEAKSILDQAALLVMA